MLLNGTDSSSSLAHRSIIDDAYPVLQDASDVSLPAAFSVGNRPEQPKTFKPTDGVLNLKWINYLRRMQSWLDSEFCLLKRAVEARSADLLSDISETGDKELENKCVSFFKLYELSDAMIGNNLTDILKKAGYGYVVSSNAPLRGPDGRFVSRSASASASAVPRDKASVQTPAEIPNSRENQSDFLDGDVIPLEIRKDPLPSSEGTSLAEETIAWYEMKEAGSPIYEEMQKVIGNKALTSSGGTKDIFGALRAEDRDSPPLLPRGFDTSDDADAPRASTGRPPNSPDNVYDDSTVPVRKKMPTKRKENWASRMMRRLANWS
jgi:hypothetical protein